MGKQDELLLQILSGAADHNVAFSDYAGYCAVSGLKSVRAEAITFSKPGIEELINLQRDGNKAKAYQVRQARMVITKYGLGGND